jgi:hypothetical protein
MRVNVVPEVIDACDLLVTRLLLDAGIEEPPVDAQQVASALGMTVLVDGQQLARGRLVRLSGGRRRGTIVLRPEERWERLQWAVAHEVGEHCAGELCAGLGMDPREVAEDAREQFANLMAARLLLPSEWLAADGAASDWCLMALKQQYATASHELLARRMLDFEPGVAITILDQGRVTFRETNQGRSAELTPIERTCWRQAAATAQFQELQEGAWRVRVWPIHEPHWRREIVRTEWLGEPECEVETGWDEVACDATNDGASYE